MGIPVEKAVSADAMNNPQTIQYFLEVAQKRES
jgi:hypothetical protein